jgi:hypothetical protein
VNWVGSRRGGSRSRPRGVCGCGGGLVVWRSRRRRATPRRKGSIRAAAGWRGAPSLAAVTCSAVGQWSAGPASPAE